MGSTTETIYDYKSILITAPELYCIGDINFASDVPFLFKRGLVGAASISGTLLLSGPIRADVLSSASILIGEAHDQHIGSSLVAWSDIGDMDFRMTRENVAGHTYMRWIGKVYQCMKLGNAMIVYGDGGITALIPNGRYYEIKDLMIPGIVAKNAVAGDENEHYFVSQKGNLFSLDKSLKLRNMGHRRWLSSLSGEVVLNYLQDLERLYISDQTSGFVMTKHGLSNSWAHLTGIALRHDQIYACAHSSLVITEQSLVTEIIDFDLGGLKTLCTVALGGTFTTQPLVALDFLYDNSSNWKRTSFKRMYLGQAFFGLTACAFRIVIKFDNALSNKLYDLSCSFKKSDKRFDRVARLRPVQTTAEAQ